MEIIQNLYKNNIITIPRIKTSILLVLILWSCTIFSQEEIEVDDGVSEKDELAFQEHFFDALTQKAINNHQKAIDLLEDCNKLWPNNKAVLFELSKNYLKLHKTPEAIEYVSEALTLEPNNLWLLEHLVTVYKKDRNYIAAIDIQERITKKHPKERQKLVYLHLKNNDKSTAKKLLKELEEAKLLTPRLRRIKANLTKVKKAKPVVTENAIKGSLEEEYAKDTSFKNLKKLLIKLDEDNNAALLKYSNEGMGLFPAQPFVYLMHGKALNKQKKHKEAIKSLENGIDFVIDDLTTEKLFYAEFVLAYKALGDTKNSNKYQKKI